MRRRTYFELLSKYARAVGETVNALVERQRLLTAGSRGLKDNPMTWERFRETDQRYKASIEKYLAIGGELNSAAPLIFD